VNNYKRDIVEEAQQVMNANKSLEHKNLISCLTNEIVALRCEVERLERFLTPTCTIPGWPRPTISVSFDDEGNIDQCRFVEKGVYCGTN